MNYGKIATPLTQLLNKDAFNWNEATIEAFNNVKKDMVMLPVLPLPDFNQPFTIETDASGMGIGAVLT